MKSIETLTIDAIAYGGEAVGRRSSGAVCFVRGALPGEVAEVEITEEAYRILRWQTVSTIEWQTDEKLPVWDGQG